MNLESILKNEAVAAISALYKANIEPEAVQIQQTRKEFEGDKTIVVFPFLKLSKKKPEATASELGAYLQEKLAIINSFSVVKGFLNLSIAPSYWKGLLSEALKQEYYGFTPIAENAKTVMVEYSSPNTNKPLHLGHIRNNLLGYSVSQILAANGYNVVKVNLVNDRGIHICKSMLAWVKWGGNETPETAGMKGDHLVGKYYVKFDQEYKAQINELIAQGKPADEAKNEAPLILEAREMLRKWESGDEETVELWKKMNQWVYDGFELTYGRMGVAFDKIYYESNTYLLGKKIVTEGLEKGILYQKEDKSVWANLEGDGLDHKLLLRPDGTSVYMTQDIGTAVQRFEEHANMEELIYVVGNEQNYHFQVLSLILGKLGYDWSSKIYHMSYGMVELPEGKMKSREGTVVDADDLMQEMFDTAKTISNELGKLEGIDEKECDAIVESIAQGALKYFMLKVEPKKTMLFNPKETIDFNGNTGPFIQYTHARISSLLRKAAELGIEVNSDILDYEPNTKELSLIKTIANFPLAISEAGKNHSPSAIANYVYELVKEYNQFYHDNSVLSAETDLAKLFRLQLSKKTAAIIKSGMNLLGITVPERM